MYMEKNDELKKLIHQLQYESSLPEVDFEMKLKAKIKRHNSPKNIFKQMSFILRNYDLNYSLAFNLLVVIFVIGVGFLLAKNFNFNDFVPSTTNKTAVFASIENQTIINNVLKNNPLMLLQDTPLNMSMVINPETNSQELADNSTVQNISDNDDNLLYSIVINTLPGLKVSYCFSDTFTEKTTSISNYRTNDNSNFYFKAIETDNVSNVISYFLSDNTRQISYLGGNYAIEHLFNGNVDNVLETTLSNTPQVNIKVTQDTLFTNNITRIENYFSTDNIELIYITQNEKIDFCPNNSNSGPVISVIVIAPQNNYKIVSKTFYLGTPTITNMIYTNYFETTTQDISEEDAIKQFQFELDKPLLNDEVLNTEPQDKLFPIQ